MPEPRSVRLNRIQALFRDNRRGFTTAELAELTGVDVRTIQRDVLTLEADMYFPLVREGNAYRMVRPQHLDRLDLDLQQARALFVATRLFLRYSDEGDPYAAGALEALARIMPEPVRAQVIAAASSMERRPINHEFARHLATITEAWAQRRVLRLSYRSAGKQRPKEVIVHPYFLEPSAAGFATYLIGYSETHKAVRTFKVERVVSAEALPRRFELPADFDIDALLSSAWGIIFGEGTDVRLRFKPDIAWRVRENTWHPSQAISELADGSVELTMTVASMMELGRWVRSWGDRVEVLAPAELREELREESVRLARMYSRKARRAPRVRKRLPPIAVDRRQAALPDA